MSELNGMSDETPDVTGDETSEQPEPGERPARSSWAAGLHQVSIGHLVMGVAFIGLFVTWIVVEAGASGDDLRWMLPVPWVAAGLAGLIAAAPRMRGSSSD